MTPKLPVISGDDLIKALSKFGYVTWRCDKRAATFACVTQLTRSGSPLPFRGTRRSNSACFAASSVKLESVWNNSPRPCDTRPRAAD